MWIDRLRTFVGEVSLIAFFHGVACRLLLYTEADSLEGDPCVLLGTTRILHPVDKSYSRGTAGGMIRLAELDQAVGSITLCTTRRGVYSGRVSGPGTATSDRYAYPVLVYSVYSNPAGLGQGRSERPALLSFQISMVFTPLYRPRSILSWRLCIVLPARSVRVKKLPSRDPSSSTPKFSRTAPTYTNCLDKFFRDLVVFLPCNMNCTDLL